MRIQILSFLFMASIFIATLVAAQTTSHPDRLHAFFDAEWEYEMKESPIFASLIGDYRYNDQIGDLSLAASDRHHEHNRQALEVLQSIDRAQLSEADQLNYDLYLQNLQIDIEGHQFPGRLIPISQLGGIHQEVPDLIPQLPFQSSKHYEDYIARLHQLPRAFDQTIERLEAGLKQKVTPPKITVREVANQIKAQMKEKAEESSFWEPFKDFPENVPASEHDRLRKAGKEAIQNSVFPSYTKLHDYWTNTYFPSTRETLSVSSLPDGKSWYRFLARRFTTTNLTPEQIHETGLKEVKRIRSEMDKVIKETGFKGSFEEFLTFLRTDPRFYYTEAEDLLAGYRDICKRIDAELPRLFGKLPRLPYGVREVPAYSAPSQTTAYYNSGSLKAGRPGWYYANTYKLETRPKWEMEALSIHEAVPGHHLQISLAQELEDVPRFRNFTGYTAFVEGWGLYSESLGPDLGMYKDPYSKFGQLTYEMWRAVRLVVDTGIHAFGWDRQKAIDYFKSNSSKPEHDITVEVDRYIVWPGQALAYKIGELKIKELRKYAEETLGEKFDIREFHDRVLENGSIPLSALESKIKQYVSAKKSA